MSKEMREQMDKFKNLLKENTNPHLKSSIDDIIKYLTENKPKIYYKLKYPTQTYYTEFELNGEKIEIDIEEPLPILTPIVIINRWQENTGKNRKLLNVIKDILKNQ